MTDTALFKRLRERMERFDAQREQLIRESRDALQLSKKAIYALHRKNPAGAKKQLGQAARVLRKLRAFAQKDCRLATQGAFLEAQEEYAEAECFYHFIAGKTFPSPEKLGVDTETYLAGVCDVVGELVRRAVNAAAQGDAKTPLAIKDAVAAIHEELMLFDFRNIPVRRKFDSIKYGLEKLENLALELSLRRKRQI